MTAASPSLRAVRQFGASPVRVELIVAAGDVLDVSDDVAGQLMAASSSFRFDTPKRATKAFVEDEVKAPKGRGRKGSGD